MDIVPNALSTLILLGILAACSSPKFVAPPAQTAPPLGEPADSAVAIVRIPAPWYAPSFVIRSKFVDAVPEYEAIAGLWRKYFTLSEDREFGGIYLWRTRAQAEAFYSEKWRARVRQRYGVDGDLSIFDGPYVIEGTAQLEAEPIDTRASRYPARATLLLFDILAGASDLARLRKLATVHGVPTGLVRSYYVRSERGEMGVVDLWATAEHAASFLSDARLAAFAAALETKAPPRVVAFDAPVLLENP